MGTSSTVAKKLNSKLILIKSKIKEKYDPLKIYTLKQIVTKLKFPEQIFFIKPLIPEGLTLLGGKPKIGKSIFSLQIAVSIARGMKLMKKFHCKQCAVYYLPLEDNFNRIKNRAKDMFGESIAPSNLLIPQNNFDFPRLNSGGLECLQKIINERKDIGVIIIDTLVRFVDKSGYGNLNFTEDSDLLSKIQSLAIRNHIAIVLIHHTTKKRCDDPFDEFQGTVGNITSADSLILLRKVGEYVELRSRGRDYEEKAYSLRFNKSRKKWVMEGNVMENDLSKEALEILKAFKKFPNKTLALKSIALLLKDDDPQNTYNKLKRLVTKGLIIKLHRNCYKLNKDYYGM